MRKSEIEAIVKMLNALDQEEDEIKKEEEAPYIKEPTKYLEELGKRQKSYEDAATFSMGNIIIWKDGMKNKRLPEYAQPCIVMRINNPPVYDTDIHEFLNIVLGFITDGDFLTFSYDSKRFKILKT